MSQTALDIALSYIERGWNPVPVPHRTKKAIDTSWQTRIIDAASAPRVFNGGPANVGVILGPTSHGLTDIDLDCSEAIAIAPYVLPKTGAVFGRRSKRNSHYLYYTDLSVTADNAAQQFEDPCNKGAKLVELRTGGAKGAQTVFPGSTHPSGEIITWEETGEPASVDGGDLETHVRLIAALSLVARYWPCEGGRHGAACIVGGFLARAGKPTPQIGYLLEAIAKVAGDPEHRDRSTAGKDAAEALRAGKKAYGFPAMRQMFGRDVAEKVAEWIGYRGGNDTDELPQQPAEMVSVRASTIEPRAIQWIWPDRFAVGKIGIIAGLPDEGKGQILCDIAARITNPDLNSWPCDEGQAPLGNVILLTAEDDLDDTVVPRLDAAGADRDRVEIVKMVREDGRPRMFSLISDLELLRQKVAEVGDVRVILIDPISAYLGVKKIDSFRTTDVRAILGPLKELAAELQVLVLGIMHFNKKVDVTNALLRISDSLAFGATARHVYAVIDEAENQRKLFVRAKNNLASRDLKALAFGFGARNVGTDPKTKQPIWAPHIIWHSQHVEVTATEAMQAASENKSPGVRDGAKKFLAELLGSGAVAQQEVKEAAEANCISWATLRRAKDDLKIIAKKQGKGGWVWELPPTEKPRWQSD
jgi:hypothetical protein